MRKLALAVRPCVVAISTLLCVASVGCGDQEDASDQGQDLPQGNAGAKDAVRPSTGGVNNNIPSKKENSPGSGTQGGAPGASPGSPETSDSGASQEIPETDDTPQPGDGKPKNKQDWDKLVAAVFPDDRVVEVSIAFQDDGLNQMLDDWRRRRKKTYQKTSVTWEGVELEGSGTRLKGYSTLMSAGGQFPGGSPGGLSPTSKLPLKLNFDRFGGERFHYLDKVSFGTNAFDKSLMRERLSVAMFRSMGVPASKTAYAALKLNEKPVGVYTITQNIDKRFLKQHFGTKNGADDGNLYKCVALERRGPEGSQPPSSLVCSLRWQGDKKSDYMRTRGCATGYENCGLVLKTNEEDASKNDYADLIHFLDVLNNSDDDVFEKAIAEVFDVDSFLRFLAVSVGMVNLDSYLGRINNFYLYHRPDTGKFIMLPWDHNMSYGHYGRVRGLSDMTQFPVKDPLARQPNRENYVLVNRILKVPSFKAKYLAYVESFIRDHFSAQRHESLISTFEQLIREPLKQDPNRQFSMEQFDIALGDNAQGASTGMGRQYNLMSFVKRRVAFVLEQLELHP